MATAYEIPRVNESIDDLKRSYKPLLDASTLPPICYTSEEWYRLEVDNIFMKEWLCVGRIDQIPNPGDYFTIDLFDEPLVVARNQDGVINTMSRVCRHRAAEVVEAGEGNTNRFRCRYHFWVYDLEGQLIGTPEMGDSHDFKRDKVCLPKLVTEVWEGFIFVNFDKDADPLSPRLEPLREHLKNYRLGELKSFVLEQRPSEEFPQPKFNWKLLMDNFTEPYHVLGLHSGSHDPMPYHLCTTAEYNDDYCFSWGKIPGAIAEGNTLWSPSGFNAPFRKMEGLTTEEQELGQFVLIYPNTLFFLSPEIVGYYQVLPRGPQHCDLTIRTLYRPEQIEGTPNFEAARQGAEASLAVINEEDMWACESMQRSYNGRQVQKERMQGRLSKWELAVNNIARYVLERTLGKEVLTS